MKPVSLGVKPFVLLFLMLYVPMLLIGWAADGMRGKLANPVGGESSAVPMLLVLVTLLSIPLFLAPTVDHPGWGDANHQEFLLHPEAGCEGYRDHRDQWS